MCRCRSFRSLKEFYVVLYQTPFHTHSQCLQYVYTHLYTDYMFVLLFHRYQIINPGGIVGVADIKKQSQLILEATPLDPDMYRIGHTKAWILIINYFHFLCVFKEITPLLFFIPFYSRFIYEITVFECISLWMHISFLSSGYSIFSVCLAYILHVHTIH